MGEPGCLAGQLARPELRSRRKWERGGMYMSDGALAAEGSKLYSLGSGQPGVPGDATMSVGGSPRPLQQLDRELGDR